MLEHLTVAQVREIIAAHAAASRDYSAMSDYLGIGTARPSLGRSLTERDLVKALQHSDELHGAEWHRLRQLTNALPQPALIELTALVWFGRRGGDYEHCLANAKQTSDGRAGDMNYLLGKSLSEYLSRALELMAAGNKRGEPLA